LAFSVAAACRRRPRGASKRSKMTSTSCILSALAKSSFLNSASSSLLVETRYEACFPSFGLKIDKRFCQSQSFISLYRRVSPCILRSMTYPDGIPVS
jgi:hypothetical protein